MEFKWDKHDLAVIRRTAQAASKGESEPALTPSCMSPADFTLKSIAGEASTAFDASEVFSNSQPDESSSEALSALHRQPQDSLEKIRKLLKDLTVLVEDGLLEEEPEDRKSELLRLFHQEVSAHPTNKAKGGSAHDVMPNLACKIVVPDLGLQKASEKPLEPIAELLPPS